MQGPGEEGMGAGKWGEGIENLHGDWCGLHASCM